MEKNIKIKLKSMLVLLLAAMLTVGVFTNVYAKQDTQQQYDSNKGLISVNIPIGNYEIKNTGKGHEISVENLGRLLISGKPNLPSKIFAIAIPPRAEIKEVTFSTKEKVTLPGSYNILPSSLPRVIGQENPHVYEKEKKLYEDNYNSVYGSDEPYPQSVGEFVRKAGYRNYNLVDVRITPFTYYPLSGKLVYYPEVTINVEYSLPKGNSFNDILADNSPRTKHIAEKIIVNYDQAKTWYRTEMTSREINDYVIVTLDSLTSSVEPLKKWEENKGKSVEVVTTSWIDSNYGGWDLAEKIRNFLREKYPADAWGILDVCLVGSYDDVPMRLTEQDRGYGKPETDYYYAELSLPDDESWDDDVDRLYGENSDPIDFYNEITVGRIPWSDPDTVEHICKKSIAYEENDDPSFKENILLIGTFFWPDTDNAVLMELKVNSDVHPWMADWNMTRMYEDEQSSYECDYDVSYDNVRDVWSAGTYAFVNWAGHGSPTACYEYYPSQPFVNTETCSDLNDDYPAIIFACACSNSDTEHDNIGQMMMEQGGVGFLGATKVAYGYHGWDDPYDGASASMDYFFTTCVTSGNYTQGQAHQYALIEMYTNGLWYYPYYESFEWGALWGNPNLGMVTTFYNKPPETPGQPDGPTEGSEDIEYTFSATTSDPEGEKIYYMFDWGDGTNSDWIGPYDSGKTGEASHIWSDAGEYEIRVMAKDINDSKSDWSDPLTITILRGPIIKPGILTGGLFKVNSNIKNIGETEAKNIKWKITLEGGTIFLGKETSGEIPTLSPDDQILVQSDPILGFGKTVVTITTEIAEGTDTRSQDGMILLFYIFVTPSG